MLISFRFQYQKIHRYSENWIHTLRYRMPELDTMAGLRRITLCGNPQLGDVGAGKLFDVLADDLWIKGSSELTISSFKTEKQLTEKGARNSMC